jgi:hypothetical protein
LKDLTLKATKKVRAQPVVELFNELLSQLSMFLFELFKVPPLVRIKEVHKVKQFSDVIV